MERVFNFAPGPSALPLSVLERAQQEMTCCSGSGMSVMEMSHRSPAYQAIYDDAVARLRALMHIPEEYAVLFMHGGATMEFSAVPLNLSIKGKADYIDSGNFAHVAAEEAKKYTSVNIVASSRADGYTYVPEWKGRLSADADYVHITTNNTIYGTRYTALPETGAVPLVADMSSNILSEPYDVMRFGVIYAGAQKNIGPSGVAVLIVRRDLLGHAAPQCPKLLDWVLQEKNGSMINTPNTWAIYLCGLCLEWLQSMGGVESIEKTNIEKAAMLYDFLDESRLFKPTAQKEFRSRMNVTFVTGSAETDARFVQEAKAVGLVNLKGHRSVGGMRASIYNAMPVEGVEALVAFMKKFEAAC